MYTYDFDNIQDITEKSARCDFLVTEELERAKDYAYCHMLTCFKYKGDYYKKTIMSDVSHLYLRCDVRGNLIKENACP